jgi:hypothetical protein
MLNIPPGSSNGLKKKVLFTGLDYSGKSTILQALQDKFTRIQTLKPTAGMQRAVFHFLDAEIMNYDLGGQKKYLIRYLRQPGKIFDDTDVAIYVVDIHDYARYGEAISYFKDLLAVFVRRGIVPALHVFLHKAENILLASDTEGTRFVEYLKDQFESINQDKFKMTFHVTTIYNTWSLTSAFSDIMHHLYPVSKILSGIIDSLVQDLFIDGAALFDPHLIMLSSSFPSDSPVAKHSTPLLYLLQHALRVCQMDPSVLRVAFEDWEIVFIDIESNKLKLKLFMFGHEEAMAKVNPDAISHFIPELFEALSVRKDVLVYSASNSAPVPYEQQGQER